MRFANAALIVWLLLTGCSSVTSTAQLGEPVAAEDAKKLEGVWLTSDGEPMWVRHVQENELRVAGIEWHESKFRLAEFVAFITEDEDRQYVNVVDTDEQGEKPTYCFLRIARQDEEYLLLSLPHAESFAKAVEEGKLSGNVTKKDNRLTVRLNSPAEKLREFVTPSKVAEQFDFDSSEVFRRVRRFDENKQ